MLCLGWICYQDFKEREVFLFLFVVLGILLSTSFYWHISVLPVFLYSLLLNLILVAILVLLSYLITRAVLKKRFLNHSLGTGDILFFACVAVGFPSMTFIILFSCALLFSLLLFLALKTYRRMETVPLAGLMSLFFIAVMGLSIFNGPSLYTY